MSRPRRDGLKIPARAQYAITIVSVCGRRSDKIELGAAVRSHTSIPIAGSLMRTSVFLPRRGSVIHAIFPIKQSRKGESKERRVDI
jgi:hypothetical protein